MRRPLTATYRLQFTPDFTFDDAAALVPYLRDLGISHAYASPIFTARTGSTHGYDVVDPTRLSDELGGEAGFARFSQALQAADLGLILDIVPNHMAIDSANAAWQDVLAFGAAAPSARLFDIDWSKERVLLPILGAPLDEALGAGKAALGRNAEAGFVHLRLFDAVLPLRASTTAALMEAAGLDGDAVPWRAAETPDLSAPVIASARARIKGLDRRGARALDAVLARTDIRSLLPDQHWELTPWTTARRRLTHRRFFNINELIGVRVEDAAVFAATHALVLRLVREGAVEGLRIDHIDGLADPAGYCRRLRGAVGPDVPVFVEKILEGEETLRPWPVQGTTGYERLCDINLLFADAAGHAALAARLRETGLVDGTPEMRLASAKQQVLAESFVSEIDQLAALAAPLVMDDEANAQERAALRRALMALAVHCPVYRSYATPEGHTDADEAIWDAMLAGLRRHESEDTQALAAVLLDRLRHGGREAHAFRTRFQQLTGPAMAKGLEDTELYRSIGLISLNEVGSDAERHIPSHASFHRRVAGSGGLVPLATHDTKLGADTRARLNVLSWHAQDWIRQVSAWSSAHAGLRREIGGVMAPDALDEWRIYQVAFGAWPIAADRLAEHMTKALREAKRHTRWEKPNEAYEGAVLAFAAALAEGPEGAAFRDDVAALVKRHDPAARINGIAQTILHLTIPGTPDIYRGTEFWDHWLVDPDNRRPVAWDTRAAGLKGTPPALADDRIGIAKQHAVRSLLTLRRTAPALFAEGSYEPLTLEGSGDIWLGFERRGGGRRLVVAVPTRGLSAPPGEGAPAISGLPPGRYDDAFGGAALRIEAGWPLVRERGWPFLVATTTD